MKMYTAIRTPTGEVRLYCNGKDITDEALARSLKIRNHSPTGFGMGYAGSGPSQLALAILLDCTDNIFVSEDKYQDFKRKFIAPSVVDALAINEREILNWIGSDMGKWG